MANTQEVVKGEAQEFPGIVSSSKSKSEGIVKKDLKSYKVKKVQFLTPENKHIRLERSQHLLRSHANRNWQRTLFTDKKLDKIQSIMFWHGICPSGKTALVFIYQGVKINQEVYRCDILESVVLLWSQEHFGNTNWTFQPGVGSRSRSCGSRRF